MSRLLALNFEHGGVRCSCFVTFFCKDEELELTISNILAEGLEIFTEPVTLKAMNGTFVSDQSLHRNMPILKSIEKAIDNYLKKSIEKKWHTIDPSGSF